MNRNGALVGILVGGITIVVWKQLTGGIFDVYEIVPGVIFSAISIVVVSLLTGGATKEVSAQHQKFQRQLVELD